MILTNMRKPCPAQLMQAILFPSFFSPYLQRTMLTRFRWLKHDSRMSLHKCYSQVLPGCAQDTSVKSYSNIQEFRQKISYPVFLCPRSVGKMPRTMKKLQRMKSHTGRNVHIPCHYSTRKYLTSRRQESICTISFIGFKHTSPRKAHIIQTLGTPQASVGFLMGH